MSFLAVMLFFFFGARVDQQPSARSSKPEAVCEFQEAHASPWGNPRVGPLFHKLGERPYWGVLADNYYQRRFSFDDFESALGSLEHLAGTINKNRAKSLGETDNDALYVYLDPTCERCQSALFMIDEVRAQCSKQFPVIVLRPLPSSERESMDASLVLSDVERKGKSIYENAFREFLHLLPGDSGRLPELASSYIGIPYVDRSPKHLREEDAIMKRKKIINTAGQFPPVLSYHGRFLVEDRASGIPFNPLHDPQTLMQTILIIQSLDAADRPQSQETITP